MTYCCGILVREGLVMIGDTRTNAGLDNISTFRKLHVFEEPGKSIMTLASAGNLSLSQTVLSILNEGIDNPETGERERLTNAPTLFQAAQRIGRALRMVHNLADRAQLSHRARRALFHRFARALVVGVARRAYGNPAPALRQRQQKIARQLRVQRERREEDHG